jgi:hypothetical protein
MEQGLLYCAADFLNVLRKGCWWGGVLLVHSEIYYAPVDDGWKEVLVRNILHVLHVLHYVTVLLQVVLVRNVLHVLHVLHYVSVFLQA